MENTGLFVLIVLAIGPFLLALIDFKRRGRLPLEEPPFKIEGADIIAFPTCFHCGWQGALDVTEFVKAAARMEELTILKSPPCYKCGQRWKINLTTLVQKYRTGAFA